MQALFSFFFIFFVELLYNNDMENKYESIYKVAGMFGCMAFAKKDSFGDYSTQNIKIRLKEIFPGISLEFDIDEKDKWDSGCWSLSIIKDNKVISTTQIENTDIPKIFGYIPVSEEKDSV